MSSSHRDYIPRNAAQFNDFAFNLIKYVESKAFIGATPPWDGAIPEARWDEMDKSYIRFTRAHEIVIGTPTSANIHRRNEAQAECTSIIRAFVNQFLRFPPVTDADRIEMRIPNHDTIRTDHKIVTEKVDFVIHLGAIRELVLDFWIQGADNKAKPEGYDGAVVIWGERDTPPDKPDELPHHAMASKTPYTLPFDELDRGKTVQIALCWQNERGYRGAWSEYKSAIVP
jgi:hypothetical protein